MNNEELQSRREFFKKAAKAALPVVAAAVLATFPAKATSVQSTYCVAGYACTGMCSGSCKGTCKFGCTGCSGACQGTCKYGSAR